MLFCVGAIAAMLWVLFFGFLKKRDINYIIISLVGVMVVTNVVVYLIGNPSTCWRI